MRNVGRLDYIPTSNWPTLWNIRFYKNIIVLFAGIKPTHVRWAALDRLCRTTHSRLPVSNYTIYATYQPDVPATCTSHPADPLPIYQTIKQLRICSSSFASTRLAVPTELDTRDECAILRPTLFLCKAWTWARKYPVSFPIRYFYILHITSTLEAQSANSLRKRGSGIAQKVLSI